MRKTGPFRSLQNSLQRPQNGPKQGQKTRNSLLFSWLVTGPNWVQIRTLQRWFGRIWRGFSAMCSEIVFRQVPEDSWRKTQRRNNIQHSKCDRSFVAPPEFKSLMLRQSTVQRAFWTLCTAFLCKKQNFWAWQFHNRRENALFWREITLFKCHFPDLNPFQARSALLLLKKPWKRSPNANKYSRW